MKRLFERLGVSGRIFLAVSAAVALFWVFLANGGALYYFDTFSYINVGDKIYQKILPSHHGTVQGSTAAKVGKAVGDGKIDASRSMVYAFLVGAFSHFTILSGVVFSQAVGVLTAAWVATRLVTRDLWRKSRATSTTFFSLIICGFSALPFYVDYLMPDIFASVGILSVATIAVYARQMRKWEFVLAWGLATIAAMTHLSHAMVLAVLLPFAAIAAWRASGSSVRIVLPALTATILAGMLPFLMLKLATTGQGPAASPAATGIEVQNDNAPSTVPARSAHGVQVTLKPFLTARLILDGPGMTFLARTCPDSALATCQLYETLTGPGSNPSQLYISQILFASNPVSGSFRLLPEDIQIRIQQEQMTLALAVFYDQPVGVVAGILKNTLDQLGRYSVDMTIPSPQVNALTNSQAPGARTELRPGRLVQDTSWLEAMNAVHLGVYLASFGTLLGLLVLPVSKLSRGQRLFGGVILAGIAANALVCGGISEPASRYGARVLWLLPFAAALLMTVAVRMRSSATRTMTGTG